MGLVQYQLDVDVSARAMITDQPSPVVDQQALLGYRFEGLFGDDGFAERISMDLHLGAAFGRRSGFEYELSILPFGVGTILGKTTAVSIGTGIAFQGATGGLDDGVLLPIEAQLDSGPLTLRARFSLVAGRTDSAPSLVSQTELAVFVGGRIRTGLDDHVLVGITYDEWLGARFAGISIGWGSSDIR